MKVIYLKLGLNLNIIEYNEAFVKFFAIKDKLVTYKHIEKVLALKNLSSSVVLKKLKPGDQTTVIILRNQKISNEKNGNAMFILYANILRQENSYLIRIVNWLNWVHNLYRSTENSYSLVGNLNSNGSKSNFSRVSDVSCFKALYPLLMHTPSKFRNHPAVLYDILHLFIQKGNKSEYSKDYSRNAYSRFQTTLKKEYGLSNVDVLDVIRNDHLVNFRYNGEICIPNTTVHQDLLIFIEEDEFLTHIINALCVSS